MSPDQSSSVDETTDTDGALLATAAEADLEPASARSAGGGEHPPGHAAPEESASAGGSSGQAARRQANPS